jgi:hypothetical protein
VLAVSNIFQPGILPGRIMTCFSIGIHDWRPSINKSSRAKTQRKAKIYLPQRKQLNVDM